MIQRDAIDGILDTIIEIAIQPHKPRGKEVTRIREAVKATITKHYILIKKEK